MTLPVGVNKHTVFTVLLQRLRCLELVPKQSTKLTLNRKTELALSTA